jgi:hypothetical protein
LKRARQGSRHHPEIRGCRRLDMQATRSSVRQRTLATRFLSLHHFVTPSPG